MANNTRIKQIGDMIRSVLSQALLRDISDPRLKLVSFTHVDITRDLAHAKIFVSSLDESQDINDILNALEKAKGFFKKIISKECHLRVIPQLKFLHDRSALNSEHISSVLDKAMGRN